MTRSAVSQAVRQLEDQLRVVLLARTTRSVALTDSGRRLLDAAGPGLGQALAALREALRRVLEPYAAEAPGYFLYFPSRAQRSGPLRLFIDAAKQFAQRRMN